MQIIKPLVSLAFAATIGLVAGQAQNHTLRGLAGGDGKIWAGTNNYFIHNFQDGDRHQVLDAMRDANLKILRIFISAVDSDNKGTGCNGVNDVEVNSPGQWDDTVLQRIDQLMVDAHDRGIKLIITLHDRWMLGHWRSDVYVSKYGIQGDNDASRFYSNTNAQADIDRRLAHILQHKNPYFNNRAWGDIDEAVFAFGIENESQGAVDNVNFKWVCNRAKALRKYISKSTILLASGGGKELDTSLHPDLMNCDSLDILGVHYYGASNDDVQQQLQDAISQNKKRIYVEEFGSNNSGNKAGEIRDQIKAVKGVGVPWMFWEISKPGKSDDYEVWTNEPAWQAIKSEASSPSQQVQSWPEVWSSGGGSNPTTQPTPTTTQPTPTTTQPTQTTTKPPGKKGDWEFCALSSECANSCCSKEYSNDGKLKCTPNGTPSKCVVGGGGSTTKPPSGNLGDWEFCSASSQCQDKCCSKQYSDDGKLKCTPGGSSDQCV